MVQLSVTGCLHQQACAVGMVVQQESAVLFDIVVLKDDNVL